MCVSPPSFPPGVDYSTIERDYGSSAGNTLTSRDPHVALEPRDELSSLTANKVIASSSSRVQDPSGIATRTIGPGTYRPGSNEAYNSASASGSNRSAASGSGGVPVLDLPNIDIGGYAVDPAKKMPSNRSQQRVQFPDSRPAATPRYVPSSNDFLYLYVTQYSIFELMCVCVLKP